MENTVEQNLDRQKATPKTKAHRPGVVSLETDPNQPDSSAYALPKIIAARYIQEGTKFYDKQNPTKTPAFEDKGKALTTAQTDTITVQSMIAVAQAKGWDSINLKGSEGFRRAAWLEAEAQGIKTKGYEPKQHELAQLEAKRQQLSHNKIEINEETQALKMIDRASLIRENTYKAIAASDVEDFLRFKGEWNKETVAFQIVANANNHPEYSDYLSKNHPKILAEVNDLFVKHEKKIFEKETRKANDFERTQDPKIAATLKITDKHLDKLPPQTKALVKQELHKHLNESQKAQKIPEPKHKVHTQPSEKSRQKQNRER